MKPKTKTYRCGCGDGRSCIAICEDKPSYCLICGYDKTWTEVKKCAQCGEYVNAANCVDICNECWLKFHHDPSDGEVAFDKFVQCGRSKLTMDQTEFNEKYRYKDECVRCGTEHYGDDVLCDDCLKKRDTIPVPRETGIMDRWNYVKDTVSAVWKGIFG